MAKSILNPLAIAVSTTLAGGLVGLSTASADTNPFGMTELSSGYTVAMEEGKCGANKKAGEGKCGGDKAKEGKCGANKKAGEGKCGGSK